MSGDRRRPIDASSAASRRPPRLSLSSGSRRNAASPKRSVTARARARERSAATASRASSIGHGPAGHSRRPEVGVAGHEPGVEEPEHRLEVAVAVVERLAHRPHAVVEVDAGVPDRVPDATGDLLDVAPPPVHEHHVEVAARAQLRPARSRRPGPPGRRRLPASPSSHGEPLVDQCRKGPAERRALQRNVSDE